MSDEWRTMSEQVQYRLRLAVSLTLAVSLRSQDTAVKKYLNPKLEIRTKSQALSPKYEGTWRLAASG